MSESINTNDSIVSSIKLVVGAISRNHHVLIKLSEDSDALIVPVTQQECIKTIRGFQQPWGVAINCNGQVIVVEGRDMDDGSESEQQGNDLCRVSICGSQGQLMWSFGRKGSRAGEFHSPRGVGVDGENNIYVVDKINCRIQKFSPKGEYITSVGVKGHGKLQFDWPKGIGIHPYTKNVYVTEANNHRLQILTPDLEVFVGKVGAEDANGKPRCGSGDGEFNTPLGVAFDKAGLVYVTDAINDRIQVFTEDGRFITKFGRKGSGDEEFDFPSAVCIDKNDMLYVTEVDNCRISVFQIVRKGPSPVTSPAAQFQPGNQNPPDGPPNDVSLKFVTKFGYRPGSEYHGGIALLQEE